MAEVADSRPDIVMVMTDQHAARCLGAAGDTLAPTPAIDCVAVQGVRFENCYCPSPLCVPSRMAFLSGLGLWLSDTGPLNIRRLPELNRCRYVPRTVPPERGNVPQG